MKFSKFLLLGLILTVNGLATSRAHATLQSATLTTLYSFNNTNSGANPYAPPVMGPDGSLYGTTAYGYTSAGTNHFPVIYKITPSGSNITLYTFSQTNGTGIAAPLVFSADGSTLYGVTTAGGSNNLGTIFLITTNGAFTNLYTFGQSTSPLGYALDGSVPYGGLTVGRDGTLYGTTYAGGISNVGTVFQFIPPNTLNTLANFTGINGAHPEETPLVEGADGIFYGTTYQGGPTNLGTVFEASTSGLLTNIYLFSGPDGEGPYNGVTLGTDGYLYGTTVQGGAKNDGTVFRITTAGALTTLFSFNNTDGYEPESGITVGLNNLLYGTTYQGGTKGLGTIFLLNTNGLLTTLYSFTNSVDGQNPAAGVILGTNGNLYGTTVSGGTNISRGTVYRLQFVIIPTLTITSPKSGQRWSNSVFQVSGTTTPGNLAVTNVLCSSDGLNWVSGGTTNNWATWTNSITLSTAGTNTIYAYAVDSGGNFSLTNTVKLDYVVTSPLILITNGEGSITPNYNNVPLQIGTTYKITAKPAKGYQFKWWTDINNDVNYAGSTLSFVMTNDLTLIAVFVYTNSPVISISEFKNGSRWSNSVITITGTASDPIGVTNVVYAYDGVGFFPATTTDNWTNWSATFTFPYPGTNFFEVGAMDSNGNTRYVSINSLAYIDNVPLTLNIVGQGTVTPDYTNAQLAVDFPYTITAKPAKGSAFYFWNYGANMVDGTTLKFTMTNNLVITANFKDVTAPTLAITAPKSNEKYSNDTITVTGTAADNVGVTAVGVEINSNGWVTASGTNNWSAELSVASGNNTIRACAMDAAGNISKTDAVSFVGELPPDWAPASITGFTALVTPTLGDPITFSFDATNFSQTDVLATNNSGTGTYTYSQTATNQGSLSLTFTTPPGISNAEPENVQWTFTGQNTGFFTNNSLVKGEGTFSLIPATNFIPTSWLGHTVTAVDASLQSTNVYKFTSKTALTINTTTAGDYTVISASPESVMLVITYTSSTNVTYVQLSFDAKTGGHFEENTYDSGGNFLDNDLGAFTFK